MTERNIRDHGLSKDCKPTGVPKATPISEEKRVAPVEDIECPHCKCKELMQVEVPVENRSLTGGQGTGFYIGCPACPWASPMMAIANAQRSSSEETEA